MSPKHAHGTTRTVGAIVLALAGLVLLAGAAAAHNGTDDHGELTFYDHPDGDGQQAPGEADPHVELTCRFWIEGEGVSQAKGTFEGHHGEGPTTHTHTLAAWNGSEEANGTHTFFEGPLRLHPSQQAQGTDETWHVRADVWDEAGERHTTRAHKIAYTPCEGHGQGDDASPPACPEDVHAEAHANENVELNWTDAEEDQTYRIYRAVEDGAFQRVDETETSTFTDVDTEADVTYRYRVTAVGETGEASGCPTVEVTAIPFLPDTGLAALAALGGIGALATVRGRRG